MQTLSVVGYEMAYLEVGRGLPLVCVHGTLGDFRTWSAVLGPLSRNHRVISVSLRHFFPEHWDGVGDDYLMVQHISDLIGFLEKLDQGPVNLMGHSRGGHIAFRIAQLRPDLLQRLVLAEPGGELDSTLDPEASDDGMSRRTARFATIAEMVRTGDSEGALKAFFEAIEGEGAWGRLAAAPKQQLRDNVFTLIGQAGENRKPYSKAEAQSIETPTLFIGGSATRGTLPGVLRALAANVPGARTEMIEGAGHWMFEHAPEQFAALVSDFLRD
jgi:esterase